MSHALVVHDGDVQEGDTLTVTGTVKRVYGGGHLAVIDLVAGSVHVPLPGPNAFPDGQVVVQRPAPSLAVVSTAPIPQQGTVAKPDGRCASCGH
jgi:hypothetical protein